VHCQPASKKKKSAEAQRQRQRQRTAIATGPKRSDSGASILRPPPLAVGVISVHPTAAADEPPQVKLLGLLGLGASAPGDWPLLLFISSRLVLSAMSIYFRLSGSLRWPPALVRGSFSGWKRGIARKGYIPRPPRCGAAVARPSGQAQKVKANNNILVLTRAQRAVAFSGHHCRRPSPASRYRRGR
jgi:hypothetical protein